MPVYSSGPWYTDVLQLGCSEVGIVTQHARDIGLWIVVDHQSAQPHQAELYRQVAGGGRLRRATFLHVYRECDRSREWLDYATLTSDRRDAKDIVEGIATCFDSAAGNAADVEIVLLLDQGKHVLAYLDALCRVLARIEQLLKVGEGVLVDAELIVFH